MSSLFSSFTIFDTDGQAAGHITRSVRSNLVGLRIYVFEKQV